MGARTKKFPLKISAGERETIVLRTRSPFFFPSHLINHRQPDQFIDQSKKAPSIVSQVQHYILVVQATDGGIPALSSTVTVYCNVVDLNDNAPIFEAGPHAVDIVENTTIGTPILSVTAQDLDSGDNGRVIYAVAGGDENGDFGVAPNGTLFTRKLLDREQKPLYNLVLSATDSPSPPGLPLSSTVQVCSIPMQREHCFSFFPFCAKDSIESLDFSFCDRKI